MIRIYFDSDVINNIHSGNSPDISNILAKNRNKLLIPFSQAHIYDKLTSRAHDRFWPDIDFISSFTDKKLLNYNKKSKFTHCEIASVREVFEAIDEGIALREKLSDVDNMVKFLNDGITELIEEFSESEATVDQEGVMVFKEFYDVMNNTLDSKDNYKDLIQEAMNKACSIEKDPLEYKKQREEMLKSFKLPSHFMQLELDQVIEHIDNEIRIKTRHDNFLEYAREDLKETDKEDSFLNYIQCYFTLGNIGYYADKIVVDKEKVFQNHLNDSMHSFFGAHSDYFVVLDRRLKAKTKVLYKLFNIDTLVVSPNELIEELNIRLVNNTNVDDVLNVINKNQPVDTLIEDGIYKFLYRLEHYFLDYFTHVQIEKPTLIEPIKIMFLKQYSNYSNVLFFEEFDSVIKNIQKYLNLTETDDVVLEEFKLGIKRNRKYSKEYFIGRLIHAQLIVDGKQFYFSMSIFTEEQITKST